MIERLKTLAVVAALATVPAQAAAQSDFDLSLEGAITLPMGDLADGWDYSGNIGAKGTFWIQEKLGIDVFGAVDMLKGMDVSPNDAYPDLNLFHAGAGVAFAVTERTEDFAVVVGVGGGYTQMKSDGLGGSAQAIDFSEGYYHGRAGADFTYALGSNLSVGFGADIVFTMADEDDTRFFPDFRPGGNLSAFSSGMTIPLTAIVKIGF